MIIYKVSERTPYGEEYKPSHYLHHDVAVNKFYEKFYELQKELTVIGDDDDPEYGDVPVWSRRGGGDLDEDILLAGIINYWVDGTTPECGEEWYISHTTVVLEKIEVIE